MDEVQRRTFSIEMRVETVNGKPKIVGHGASFNSLSEDMGGYREIIKPGAFRDALENSDPVALINHDPNLVLGRKSAGTLRVWEDNNGLAYEIDPPNTSYANDLIEVMKRGDVKQSSFAFTVSDGGWIKQAGKDVYEVRKVKRLYDVSPVTYPAYPASESYLRKKPERTDETMFEMNSGEFEMENKMSLENMDPIELLQKRAEYINTAQDIRRKAFQEKRKLSKDEERKLTQLLTKIKRCTKINNDREYERLEDARNTGYGYSPQLLEDSDDFTVLERDLSKPFDKPFKPGEVNIRALGGSKNTRQLEPGEIRVLTPEQKFTDVIKQERAFGSEPQDENLSLHKMVRGVILGDWAGADAERRAMGEVTGGIGGFLVPSGISANIIDLARNQAACIRAGARSFPMTEPEMTIIKIVSDPTAYWRKENEAITESDSGFAPIKMKAIALGCLCRVSLELLEDARNFTNTLEGQMAAAIALELDRVGLFGAGVKEPRGIWNTPDIQTYSLGDNGAALTGYDPFSYAAEYIQNYNGQPNSVIYSPRTAGALDRLKDKQDQPLTPPDSFKRLSKFTTNQIPNNLKHGTATNASAAIEGDFSQLLFGIRTNLQLDISRAGGGTDDAFSKMQILIRAYIRADVAVLRPKWFTKITGIIPA